MAQNTYSNSGSKTIALINHCFALLPALIKLEKQRPSETLEFHRLRQLSKRPLL